MPGGQIAVWDITIDAQRNDREVVSDAFKALCKKWCYQKEEAPSTGWLHWQCRISLVKKKTQKDLVECLDAKDLEGFHVSPSSGNSLKGSAFYCMKEDTRVEGPWTDQDPAPKPLLKTPALVDSHGLLPWQNSLMNEVSEYDPRSIHVVVDREGNSGKSSLCKWVWCKDLGQPVPAMTSAEDLVQFVMCMPATNLYIIDMPRAMKKKSLFGMYSGIENLKNGMLFDKRYKGVFKYIDEPNIIVFTNQPPKLRYLSKDRWKLWTIKDQQLEVFKFTEDNVQDVGTHP